MTALRLLAVLNVLSRSGAERKSLLISAAPRYEWPSCSRKSTPPLAERRAPCTDVPLTHFAPPRGEKSGLATFRRKIRVALGAGTVTNFAPSKNQQLTGAFGHEIG